MTRISAARKMESTVSLYTLYMVHIYRNIYNNVNVKLNIKCCILNGLFHVHITLITANNSLCSYKKLK